MPCPLLARRLVATMLLLASLSTTAAARDLLLFGAASTKEAVDAVTAAYEEQGGGRVVAAYASSSTLARQIEQGAQPDIYLSANPDWMDYLEQRGLIVADSRVDLLGNGLVLIAPRESQTSVELTPTADLAGVLGDGRLAMGDPDHVPAGRYGRLALQSLGLWEKVADKAARTDNVRVALAFVARGEAPLGIVYSSDALAETDVRVVAWFPPDSHPPIVYPVAILRDSAHPEAQAFRSFLETDRAVAIFERFGFRVIR